MAQVTVTARRAVGAPADRVREALADYTNVRPKLLTEHFSDYRVKSGGQGAPTLVHWRLAATQKRVRDQLVDVSGGEDATLVERDRNSSMVTTWTVHPDGDASIVAVQTQWNGAGGIGGFFERTFAPIGLRKIYNGMLTKLDDTVRAG